MTVGEYMINTMNFKNEEHLLSDLYQCKIYISDVVDEVKLSMIHDLSEWFIENDEGYDGDELEAWKRFLKLDLNTLID